VPEVGTWTASSEPYPDIGSGYAEPLTIGDRAAGALSTNVPANGKGFEIKLVVKYNGLLPASGFNAIANLILYGTSSSFYVDFFVYADTSALKVQRRIVDTGFNASNVEVTITSVSPGDTVTVWLRANAARTQFDMYVGESLESSVTTVATLGNLASAELYLQRSGSTGDLTGVWVSLDEVLVTECPA
jgi:hypothetical protein